MQEKEVVCVAKDEKTAKDIKSRLQRTDDLWQVRAICARTCWCNFLANGSLEIPRSLPQKLQGGVRLCLLRLSGVEASG